MEDPAILDLDYSTFSQIQNILENSSTMKSFLEVLPPDCSRENIINSMDIEGRKYNMTPAKYLLQFLGSRQYRVSDLVEWFEAINLEKALVHLKQQEFLRIIKHPDEIVKIKEGDQLVLKCCATSYPPPEYQWFRNDEDLLLEVDAVLCIKNSRLEDSGVYTCLVTRWNAERNRYDFLYSAPSHVEVIQSDISAAPSFTQSPQLPIPNFKLPRKCVPQKELNEDFTVSPPQGGFIVPHPSIELPRKCVPQKELIEDFTVSPPQGGFNVPHPNIGLNKQDHVPSKQGIISITKHPYVDGKVSQGMSICLNCEAFCSFPVNYQWFKNGRYMHGEESSQLILCNLYPDPDTGIGKWEYQCQVYNEDDQAFSQTAVVELDEVNETTPYTAQEKLAFLVANDTYDRLEGLLKPAPDMTDVAQKLSSLGFKIFAFRNVTLTEMRNAFTFFCSMLKPGSYALFFFSGHGFEVFGQTYLQPVDSSENLLQQESICSEYILKCLQETKPAMIILFIDACRKLPPNMNDDSTLDDTLQPAKIFKAKMKNNTIYGYSTSFLCASHESDSEANSVFVKHLKKYLTYNKSIQEILLMVQADFAKDPLTKNLQFPVIKSTLAQPRKLWDPLQDSSTSPSPQSTILQWCDMKKNSSSSTFILANLSAKIIVEYRHHMEVFCNGVDAFVYLLLEPKANLLILNDMEIDIIFNSPLLKVEPIHGVALKNIKLQIGVQNFLFKKEVLNVQKINEPNQEGIILLKFCSKNYTQKLKFSTNLTKITELQLSLNHLQSDNIEVHKNCSLVQNAFK